MAMNSTNLTHSEPARAWWKEAVIYQIYPSSFLDTNGDGIGDFNGIHNKLDYLKDLGVDVLWFCPIYKSGGADGGYDISDYYDADPKYGTLEDLDRLMKGIHERGMKLMMDLVVNHSSDENPWFIESKSSKTNSKRDWYYWRPPRYDAKGNRHPPNNWRSLFAGSAWQYDSTTDEYYLHLYAPQQPDLNWTNPEVREAIWKMMEWWLERGVDGFRLDAISLLAKTEGFPDVPISDPNEEFQSAMMHFTNNRKVHDYLKEMNQRVLSRYDTITVGQTKQARDLSSYVLPPSTELDMVFQFDLMHLGHPPMDKGGGQNALVWHPFPLKAIKDIITRWQGYMRTEGYWNTVFLENHDYVRSVSRLGNDSDDELRTISAKMLAVLQISQSGTLFVYQGEEIAMRNVPKSWGIEEYKDRPALGYYQRALEERKRATGLPEERIDMRPFMENLQRKARDNARTPMQWNTSQYAGFTTEDAKPWMRVNDDYPSWNVEKQIKDPSSVLTFWKAALQLRKRYDVLIYGDFKQLDNGEDERIYVILRTSSTSEALILLNLSAEGDVTYVLSTGSNGTDNWSGFRLVLDNYRVTAGSLQEGEGVMLDSEKITLKSYQALVYIREL